MFLEFGEDLNTAGRSSLMGDNSETTQPFSTPRRRRQSRLLELERYVHANGGLMLEENASRSSRAIYRISNPRGFSFGALLKMVYISYNQPIALLHLVLLYGLLFFGLPSITYLGLEW
ncbi:CACTA en-spm transposon protein [Cucumis melo var. makuwa]|uniref:CACTA en-spm transposon protein n=1 Tax=Cucumis melo var. makuwa TaxID=1194695 RepID=A0A5D3CD42_CUCMM|nr:CACTA en-spm transposon protein [Cucumis melo var. makuwa]